MHPHNQMNSVLLTYFWRYFRIPRRYFPSLLKYILPTSIKMKIFNIKSFLCSFHRTISEYFVIFLCYRGTKRKEGIFATCHKAGSSSPHLLFTEFHLDPLEGLKALLFIYSSEKGFSFSLKLILMYFKDLLSTNIIHLSSCDPKAIPLSMPLCKRA